MKCTKAQTIADIAHNSTESYPPFFSQNPRNESQSSSNCYGLMGKPTAQKICQGDHSKVQAARMQFIMKAESQTRINMFCKR